MTAMFLNENTPSSAKNLVLGQETCHRRQVYNPRRTIYEMVGCRRVDYVQTCKFGACAGQHGSAGTTFGPGETCDTTPADRQAGRWCMGCPPGQTAMWMNQDTQKNQRNWALELDSFVCVTGGIAAVPYQPYNCRATNSAGCTFVPAITPL